MASSPLRRVIFLPFIDSFGGNERLILSLSRSLYEAGRAHTIASFRQTIDLQSYAGWPLNLHHVSTPRNSLSEALALSRFLLSVRSGALQPLLFDLKSAFYSGLCRPGPFFLHLTDPPGLLPADISKHAPSARASREEFGSLRKVGAMRTIRAEVVHRLNRRGAQRASKVIVMTSRIQKELQQLYNVDALVIPPGVSAKGFQGTAAGDSEGALRMLSVSRLEPNKRIDWILRALAAFELSASTNAGNWALEIIGEGTAESSLRELAENLGMANRIHFRGHVTDETLAGAYSRANLFLMPAVQGYGLPALEALQRGLPVIVHKDSGVSEVLHGSPWVAIINGEDGSLVNAIQIMAERLRTKTLSGMNMPTLPEDTEWANAVCQACGWMEG